MLAPELGKRDHISVPSINSHEDESEEARGAMTHSLGVTVLTLLNGRPHLSCVQNEVLVSTV